MHNIHTTWEYAREKSISRKWINMANDDDGSDDDYYMLDSTKN